MTKNDDWFDDWFREFFNTYPDRKPLANKNYCKGSFDEVKECAAINIKSEDLAIKVILALREQIKFIKAALEVGEKDIFTFPSATTWIIKKRWGMQIGSYSELNEVKQKRELKTCSQAGCTEKVHGSRFDKCARHLTETNDFNKQVNESMIKFKMHKRDDETLDQWRMRIRTFCHSGYENFNRSNVTKD